MPTISVFYGIIIRLYTKNEHNPPHIHAKYGDEEAEFDFEGNIVGEFPKKQTKLVVAWIEIHKDELNAAWELAQNLEPVPQIKPLD